MIPRRGAWRGDLEENASHHLSRSYRIDKRGGETRQDDPPLSPRKGARHEQQEENASHYDIKMTLFAMKILMMVT